MFKALLSGTFPIMRGIVVSPPKFSQPAEFYSIYADGTEFNNEFARRAHRENLTAMRGRDETAPDVSQHARLRISGVRLFICAASFAAQSARLEIVRRPQG